MSSMSSRRGLTRPLAILLVLAGASSYGLLSPVIKIAYEQGWSDQQITAAQMTYSAAFLWLLSILRPSRLRNPFGEPWVKLGLVGTFGLAATTVLMNAALTELSATLAVVLLFQFTWITMLMEAALLRRWPVRRQWAAAAVIWVGTLLAVGLSFGALKATSMSGLGFGLGSAVSYSVFLVFAGRVQTRMHAVQTSAVMLTAALPFVYLIYAPGPLLVREDFAALLGWGLVLGLLGSIIPTVFFTMGIPKIGSSLAAVLGSVELPVAVVAALLIVGENVHGLQWLGIALIISGMAIAEYTQTPAGGNFSGNLGKNESVEE